MKIWNSLWQGETTDPDVEKEDFRKEYQGRTEGAGGGGKTDQNKALISSSVIMVLLYLFLLLWELGVDMSGFNGVPSFPDVTSFDMAMDVSKSNCPCMAVVALFESV